MKKNLTIKISESLAKRCHHAAIDDDKSLSQWVADLMAEAIVKREALNVAKKKGLKALESGLSLGGKPLSREEAHER